MESYKVIWDNKEVGELIDPRPDMWYLEGDWKPNKTAESEKFERIMMSVDAKQVFNDIARGQDLVLRNLASLHDMQAVGISLDQGRLFVRRVERSITQTFQKKGDGLIDKILRLFRR